MKDTTADHHDVARSFGANVNMKELGAVLCLVIGRVSPIAAINAVEGNVAVVLSPTRVLAVIELTLLSRVQSHRDILLAGPVNIDPARMARFANLVRGASPA